MLSYTRQTEAQAFQITSTDDYTKQGRYTFTLKLGGKGIPAFTKTTNIVADSDSTIKVTFTANELDSLPIGVYRMELYATDAANSNAVELIDAEPFYIRPGLL